MLDKIAETVVERLLRKNVIIKEDYEIYEFGIKQLIITIVNMITAIVIGIVTKELVQTIIFVLAFMIIRSNAGGYHATTPLKCYVLSTLTIFITLSAMKHIELDMFLLIIMLLCSSLVILILAPVDTENKPLDNLEHGYYRKKARIVWGIETLLAIVCVMVSFGTGAECIAYAQVVVSISLISEYFIHIKWNYIQLKY